MTGRPDTLHASAEQLQALFDGTLPGRERGAVEEHLGSCAECSARAEGWSHLFDRLESVPRVRPSEGFADRVMAGVRVADAEADPASLAARVRHAWARLRRSAHAGDGRLQDYVDGMLPTTAAARVAAHLSDCASCAREVSELRDLTARLVALGHVSPRESFREDVLEMHALLRRLDRLDHLDPGPAFADRVLAALPTGAHVQARPTTTPAANPAWGRLLAAARSLVPGTRQAWAAVSGVAVTPVVTLGLVVWAVFSHPTLTPGALAAFAWWQITDAALWVWNGAVSAALESAGVLRLYEVLASLAGAPNLVAFGFLAFAFGTLASLWVLYKNLLVARPVAGRYAHASH